MRSPVSFVTGFRFDLRGGVSYAPHRHRAVEIVLHAAGSGALHLPGAAPTPFSAGEASICPANQVHHQAMAEPGTDLCILLMPRKDLAAPLPGPLITRGPLSAALRHEIDHLVAGPSAAGTAERAELDLRAATVLAGLLARAQPCGGAAPATSLADDAAHHLAAHYATIGSIEEVARALAVGTSRLRREFAARHGESMVRHLARIRVDRAKELLAHSPLSLREIAARCGFASEQYLCAVFARLEGMPPGAFRAARGGR